MQLASRILLPTILLTLAAASPVIGVANQEPVPDAILDGLQTMSEVRATAQTCAESKLPVKRSLRFSSITLRLDELVTLIESKHSYDFLLLPYMRYYYELMANDEFIRVFREQYSSCSDTLIVDLYEWVEEAEQAFAR